jgi:hypothetical protein
MEILLIVNFKKVAHEDDTNRGVFKTKMTFCHADVVFFLKIIKVCHMSGHKGGGVKLGQGGLVTLGRVGQLKGSKRLEWREACNCAQSTTNPSNGFLC